MNPVQPAVDRIERALSEVADALAAADLDRLLAAESGLSTALGQLGVTSVLEESGRDELREAIDRAYTTLLRCRRLGACLASVARVTTETSAAAYGRSGIPPTVVRTTSVEMRG